MTWAGVVFVVAFCSLVYFLEQIFRSAIDPQFKSDWECLREQRRRRKR